MTAAPDDAALPWLGRARARHRHTSSAGMHCVAGPSRRGRVRAGVARRAHLAVRDGGRRRTLRPLLRLPPAGQQQPPRFPRAAAGADAGRTWLERRRRARRPTRATAKSKAKEEAQQGDPRSRPCATRSRMDAEELVARPRDGAAAVSGRCDEPGGLERAAEDARGAAAGRAAAARRRRRRAPAADAHGRCQRILFAGPTPEQALARWLEGQLASPTRRCCWPQPAAIRCRARRLAADGFDAAAWIALPKRIADGKWEPPAGATVPRLREVLQKLCHDAMAVAAGAATTCHFPAASLPPWWPAWARLADWSQSLWPASRAHDEHPFNAPLITRRPAGRGESRVGEAARTRGPERPSRVHADAAS